MARTPEEIISSGVGTMVTIGVASVATRMLGDIESPRKRRKKVKRRKNLFY